MGIEDDITKIKAELGYLNECFRDIEQKIYKLLEAKKPKDRKDKEKRIKDSMTDEIKLNLNNVVESEHTEMG